MLGEILLVFAFVCATIAAFFPFGSLNIGWASLSFYFASLLFAAHGFK